MAGVHNFQMSLSISSEYIKGGWVLGSGNGNVWAKHERISLNILIIAPASINAPLPCAGEFILHRKIPIKCPLPPLHIIQVINLYHAD